MPNNILSIIIAGVAFVFLGVTMTRAILFLMRSLAKRGFNVPKFLKLFIHFWYAWVQDQTIYFENDDGRKFITADKIKEIKFHYNTVGGYDAWIELTADEGDDLIIDLNVAGMDSVWHFLEKTFRGVTRAKLDECVQNGDVIDECIVWEKRTTSE